MHPPPDRLSSMRLPSAAVFLGAIAALSIPALMLFADRSIALAMQELPGWFRNLASDITWLGKALGWLLLTAGLALFWAWRSRRSDPVACGPSLDRQRALASAFLFAVVGVSGILTNLI